MLKFQVSSYSALDKIDVGVYIVTRSNFQRTMKSAYQQNWEGSLSFEKVKRYLPHLKSAIQVPIYVIGLDV
ncbi:MAG: BglII/BstYI family type II restriction endonuclease [Acidobacteriota bacterium]|nr:BglII/BstYI family type II restriction endonuclease [Acidobacteriota bacterium]